MARVLLATALVLLAASTPGLAQRDKPESTTALRKRGKAALEQLKKGPDHERAQTVLALVKRLQKERKRSEAVRYLRQLTQRAPDVLEAQLLYAEHLQATGKKRDARRIADRLLEVGETDAVRVRALQLVDAPVDLTIPPLTPPTPDKARVVLLPFGRVTKTLLLEVRRALAEEVGIEVVIRQTAIERPKPKIPDPKQDYDVFREMLRGNMNSPGLEPFVAKAKISERDFESDERVVAAVRRWIKALEKLGGAGDTAKQLREIDSFVRFATEPKWSAEQLLTLLHKKIRKLKHDRVVFLAVTSDDIYAKDLDHVYSWTSNSGFGVVSLHRFTSARNAEMPSWDRLRERALKHTMCSLGRVVGVSKCPDSSCVFARAGGIKDHDRKRGGPCESCAAKFRKRLPR